MQMAGLQSEPHRQSAMLQEAMDCLSKAQAWEDAQFALATGSKHGGCGDDGAPRHAAPPPPKILQRTPTSCTLVNFPLHGLKGKKPAK